MKELARISLTGQDGKPLNLPAALIGPIEHASQTGALITMFDGTKYQVQTSVADIHTAINALWDEFLVALTG
jgi:uncharacterized protein YlzI (FlbEa/FlbD family)